jgi:hypothetical protein
VQDIARLCKEREVILSDFRFLPPLLRLAQHSALMVTHSGTMNQLGPPCPEYVKLRPGTIAKPNITIGKLYSLRTSRQKLGEGLLSVGTAEVASRLPGARRQTTNPATAKAIEPERETNPGMYGPPRRRKRNVRVSRVGLRKCRTAPEFWEDVVHPRLNRPAPR